MFAKYGEITTKNIVSTILQNANGIIIRGNLLPKNGFISQTLPKDNAPDSIKNKSTPILGTLPKIKVIIQLNVGTVYSFKINILIFA